MLAWWSTHAHCYWRVCRCTSRSVLVFADPPPSPSHTYTYSFTLFLILAYQAGENQPGVSRETMINGALAIQEELAARWNYALILGNVEKGQIVGALHPRYTNQNSSNTEGAEEGAP